MPKRLPYEILIIGALALGSCSGPSPLNRLDLAEINIRNAARASSEMADRVERAERRISEIENKLDM